MGRKNQKKQDGTKKVLITMRKTFEASKTFDVTDEQMTELKNGINPFEEFLEWMIDSWDADERPDFEVRGEDGGVISPFAFPFAEEGCKDALSVRLVLL